MMTIAAFAMQGLAAAGSAVASAGSFVAGSLGIGGAGASAAAGASATTAAGLGATSMTAAEVTAFNAAGAGAATAGAGLTASQILSGLSVGTSLVSGLSTYMMGQQQAGAANQDAFDEDMQANQSYVQSQQQANDIMTNYNKVVNLQLATAAASGVDVGSGSVAKAQQDAESEADNQLEITRDGGMMNAALRQSRAVYLRSAAGQDSAAGDLGALAKVGTGFLQAAKVA